METEEAPTIGELRESKRSAQEADDLQRVRESLESMIRRCEDES